MKKLTVKMNDEIVSEYHANEEAAFKRLNWYKKNFDVKTYAVEAVIKHVEVKESPKFTTENYSKIK